MLSSVCDPSPEAPPLKASFLGMCFKCKVCPTATPNSGDDAHNGSSSGGGGNGSGNGSRPVRVQSYDDASEDTAVAQEGEGEGDGDLESGRGAFVEKG